MAQHLGNAVQAAQGCWLDEGAEPRSEPLDDFARAYKALRALMQPFDFLIMDEPFSHLDNVNKKIAAALISAECKRRNAGIIITDLDEDDHFDYHISLNL